LSIQAAVAKGVASAGKWKVTAGKANAKLPGGDADATGSLDDADQMLKDAKAKVRQLELEKALSVAKEAVTLYSAYLHKLIKRDGSPKALVNAHVAVATVEYLNGKEEAASKALLHAFVLDPKLVYDPKRFPPQLQELVMQEKALFSNAGTGAAKVTVNSPGTLYINGVKAAQAPMAVKNLPAGPNLVTLIARGAKPTVKVVQVKGKGTVEIAIAANSPKSSVRGVFKGTRGDVGDDQPSSKLIKAAAAVGAEGLLLILPKVSDEKTTLVAYVYDMRSKTKAGRYDTSAEPEDIDSNAEKLAAEAGRSAKWRLVAGLSKPVGKPLWKRLYQRAYKHKYFWHAVGATAGVVLISVVAVASSGMSPGKRVALFPSLVNF